MSALLEKSLPCDLDAERTVLGTLLQNPEWLDVIALTANAFFHTRHGLLFEAIESLYADGQPVEIKALSGRLRDKGVLEQIGGITYLGSLIDGMPGSDPFYYADRIRSKYLQRRCMRAGEAIVSEAMDAENGVDSLAFAEKTVAGLAETGAGRGARSAADVAMGCLTRIEEATGPRGIKTGLLDLDRLILSLEPETLTLVGARPSNGKSAFGLTLALNVASEGVAVGFFSLEMTAESLTDRLLAMLSGIDLMELRAGYRLSNEKWGKLVEAQGALQSMPIFIDDTRGLTAGQICARIRRLNKQQPLGVGVVDYLTRLRFSDKREMRHELGDAAKRFKDLSGELQVPIVALSQLSRASVATKVRRPQLSDLRESGNLEEDADNVFFVHREEMYDPTDENRGLAEIIIAKQRQGPAPEIVGVSFHGPTARFHNASWR